MKAAVKAIQAERETAIKLGTIYQVHAARCPYPSGGECVCVPYHVFPSDDRPTAEIVETVERRKRA